MVCKIFLLKEICTSFVPFKNFFKIKIISGLFASKRNWNVKKIHCCGLISKPTEKINKKFLIIRECCIFYRIFEEETINPAYRQIFFNEIYKMVSCIKEKMRSPKIQDFLKWTEQPPDNTFNIKFQTNTIIEILLYESKK